MDLSQQSPAQITATPPFPLFQTVPIALFCIGLIGISILWHQADPTIARENGPMENFEAACLFAGMIVFLLQFRRSIETWQRVFCGSLALFYATFLVLEVDVRDTDFHLLIKLLNGRVRDVWLGAFWIIAAAIVVRNARKLYPLAIQWLRSTSGKFMHSAGALWLGSAAVDKSLFVEKSLFLEELLEVPATFLMFASAILLRGFFAKPRCEK